MSSQRLISIVGGESLLGRELRELIEEQKAPVRLQLVGVDEASATLTEQDGEAVIIPPLGEESLAGSQVAFLAGSPESGRKALAMIARSPLRPKIVDLTYIAEDEPSARLRAPLVETEEAVFAPGTIHVIAHPAATAMALLLMKLDAHTGVRRSVMHVFEPSSERGRPGIEELRQQTVGLFSFKPLQKEVFDAQIAFNLLSSYGSQARESLHSVELRIEKHLASLLSGQAASLMPSLRLVQAPVFHGYSISAYVEFANRPDVDALTAALSSPFVDVRCGETSPPDNAGIAGQSGVAVGSIAPDRHNPSAVWFWLVADNIRLMAENGVAVALSLLAGGTRGGAA